MTNSKYERRSAEAQVVMNKAPHTFITWGNCIILGIILVYLAIAGWVDIPRSKTLPCRLEQGLAPGAGNIVVRLDTDIPEDLDASRLVNVTPVARNGAAVTILSGRIDSTWSTADGSWVRITSVPPIPLVRPGAPASIKFMLHRISLFTLLYRRGR